jgi:LruC domain-containing protein
MKTLRIIVAGAVLAASTAALATTVSNSKVVWTFLKGGTTYSSTNYDGSGIPKSIDSRKTLSTAFLTRVANALPERSDIRTRAPQLITNDAGANLQLKKDADVYVTFIHEGAGYTNSVGFFTWQDGALPTKKTDVRETIVFPNASFYNDGGSSAGLKSGDTLKIGHFTKGTNIGFMLVSNGFDSSKGVTTAVTGGPPGGDWTFYTLKALNPESSDALKAHTVLLNDTDTGMIVLGMEDLKRSDSGCDHDFNDMIYTITSEPADAFDTEDVAIIPTPDDKDNDGVKDGVDDHPDDGTRAFDVYTPSKDGYGSLVWEDSWPRHGDYDFNDLVVKYQYLRVSNKDNKVLDLIARFEVLAWGSENANGFAFHVPGINVTQLLTATLSVNGGTPTNLAPEVGQPDLVFVLSPDMTTYMTPKSKCATFNTTAGCDEGAGPSFDLRITFKSALEQAVVGIPPWDPFIFRATRRGQEVHLPDVPPTAVADMTLFRTQDDDSVAASGRWYRSICNLPWGLDIPAAFAWPTEGVEIIAAYTSFLDWVKSSGASARDWYVTSGVARYLWSR